jgi:uncharacterized protein (DUF58 family)
MVIYPTRAAVLLAAAGAPAVALLGALAPGLWLAGAAWVVMTAGLCLVDARLAADRRGLEVDVRGPRGLGVGSPGQVQVTARFSHGAPAVLEATLAADGRLRLDPSRRWVRPMSGEATFLFGLTPVRRGEGRIERVWLRWRGPLGLVWKQRVETLDLRIPVSPDVAQVKGEAIRLFSREASLGAKVQLDPGTGSEFHALRDFQPGMDRRGIDWRRSARHERLLAKEHQTERNHQLVLAIDAGRAMCEPLRGVAKVDVALNAALLLAYVSLKLGDRVGLYSFDARPQISTGAVAGVGAFPVLQRIAARIDYSAEETNFTLGLTSLAAALEKRSLVVVFTEFTDSTSAELMVENIGRLLSRHLVLFVVFPDLELQEMVEAEPCIPDDVSRAVIAQTLLRERDVVIGRLRRMGVQIVEASADRIGPELVSSYLDLKRREVL